MTHVSDFLLYIINHFLNKLRLATIFLLLAFNDCFKSPILDQVFGTWLVGKICLLVLFLLFLISENEPS